MEFTTLVESRYSVRSYKTDPIEEKKLQKVLQAMRLAPTATNNQAFQFIVIHTKGRDEELRRIYNKNWFVQAPVVICACGIPAENWVRMDGKNYNDVDVAIAMDHLILAATDAGLGTCWIGAFDAQAAKEVLGLPEGVEPIAFTPLGHPAGEPKPKKRKELSELVRYERW
jgi:nitroreductase